MILFFMFILVSIAPLSLHADENFLPSFRSSVVTNGKPILRGGGPEPEEEDEKTDTGNVELKEEDTTETQEKATKGELERNNMVNSVTVLLDWLINSYGYKIDNNLRRAGDGPDSGPLEEEFRSHRQKRKNKKHRFGKVKGPTRSEHKKSKHWSSEKNDENISNEKIDYKSVTTESLIAKKVFKADGEIFETDSYNNNNLYAGKQAHVENVDSNTNNEPEVTSINLMNIVDMIRNKISSFGANYETTPPESLRMPIYDSNDNSQHTKQNYSLAVSFQL